MQESPFFQRQREKFITQGIAQGAKAATLKNLMAVLNAKFHSKVQDVRPENYGKSCFL